MIVSGTQCIQCYHHTALRPLQDERLHLQPCTHIVKNFTAQLDECCDVCKCGGFPYEQFVLQVALKEKVMD